MRTLLTPLGARDGMRESHVLTVPITVTSSAEPPDAKGVGVVVVMSQDGTAVNPVFSDHSIGGMPALFAWLRNEIPTLDRRQNGRVGSRSNLPVFGGQGVSRDRLQEAESDKGRTSPKRSIVRAHKERGRELVVTPVIPVAHDLDGAPQLAGDVRKTQQPFGSFGLVLFHVLNLSKGVENVHKLCLDTQHAEQKKGGREVKRLVATTLLVSLVLVGSALADTKTIQDPDDDTGDSGDIRSATAGHTPTGKLKHTIVTWNKAGVNTDPPGLVISLAANDVNANCDRGYEGLFSVKKDGAIRRLCDNVQVGTATVKRPNPKTIIFKFGRKPLGSPTKYFWGVQTYGSNPDVAPNDSQFVMYGWGQDGIKHKL